MHPSYVHEWKQTASLHGFLVTDPQGMLGGPLHTLGSSSHTYIIENLYVEREREEATQVRSESHVSSSESRKYAANRFSFCASAHAHTADVEFAPAWA